MEPNISVQIAKPGRRYSSIILGSFLVLIIVGLLFFGYQHFISSRGLSSNILEITQPVYSISGKINSIKANTITMSFTSRQSTTPKTIVYQILITKDTRISSYPDSALLEQGHLAQLSLTLKDLKVGQLITVTSNTDLRTTGNQFEAAEISFIPGSRLLSGVISNISGDILVVTGVINSSVPTFTAPSQSREYKIQVTSDTQINQLSTEPTDQSKPSKPKNLSLSDLKTGMGISLTTVDEIVDNGVAKAKEITISVPPPTPPLIATPSATPKS